ncbi:MAG: polysaccharide deacetylase family protein [Flavobacteriaceae bacterium]|nr:polysaccharide deacetylase family protein [Flavobacteriaceae bacterium]
MKLYFIKTPRIIQRIFKNYTWRFFTNKKEIYLTFDDGPTPEITDWTLDLLHKYNAKATFFCLGKNVLEEPKIYSRILKENHRVGNHTHTHKNGTKTDLKTYINNILEAEKHLENPSKLFRPPYGKIKSAQAKNLQSLGYTIIMWDVLSADFDTTITKEKCLKNVLRNTKNGSIIVFHDSIKASKNLHHTLPNVLAYYSKKGYVFKAIS